MMPPFFVAPFETFRVAGFVKNRRKLILVIRQKSESRIKELVTGFRRDDV